MQPDMSLATNLTAIFGTFQDVDDFLRILSGCFLCSSRETTNSVSFRERVLPERNGNPVHRLSPTI